jgi:hypothetical protein
MKKYTWIIYTLIIICICSIISTKNKITLLNQMIDESWVQVEDQFNIQLKTIKYLRKDIPKSSLTTQLKQTPEAFSQAKSCQDKIAIINDLNQARFQIKAKEFHTLDPHIQKLIAALDATDKQFSLDKNIYNAQIDYYNQYIMRFIAKRFKQSQKNKIKEV